MTASAVGIATPASQAARPATPEELAAFGFPVERAACYDVNVSTADAAWAVAYLRLDREYAGTDVFGRPQARSCGGGSVTPGSQATLFRRQLGGRWFGVGGYPLNPRMLCDRESVPYAVGRDLSACVRPPRTPYLAENYRPQVRPKTVPWGDEPLFVRWSRWSTAGARGRATVTYPGPKGYERIKITIRLDRAKRCSGGLTVFTRRVVAPDRKVDRRKLSEELRARKLAACRGIPADFAL